MVWRPGSCLISPRVTSVILNKLKAVFGGGLRCPSVFYGESTTTFSKILSVDMCTEFLFLRDVGYNGILAVPVKTLLFRTNTN